MMLKPYLYGNLTEAGCDEAGRGCLAGPVTAAAVILPKHYRNGELNDSKQLSEKQRKRLRDEIMGSAVSWKVAFIDNKQIDEMNILRASIKAMHLAIASLEHRPQFLLIDGNSFYSYPGIDHKTIVKGDSLFLSIAAASILAKTSRDEYMEKLHEEFPQYMWNRNKGYPTPAHRAAIIRYGITPYHRRSFNLFDVQLKLDL